MAEETQDFYFSFEKEEFKAMSLAGPKPYSSIDFSWALMIYTG